MIPNSLIMVVQSEPRDGDMVYLEKDMEAFRNRVVELDMVEADVAGEIVELGQKYWNDDDSSTIIGYEVPFPYPISNVCLDCFARGKAVYDEPKPKVGSHAVVNFVASGDCEFFRPGE
jgi:hypothetical protein